MPGKSRQGKGRRLSQSKRKGKEHFVATVTPQEAVSQSTEVAPSVSVPTPVPRMAGVRYPHIAAELRAIGILAVVIIVVLIVLALVPLPW